jgi:bifunctional pyridoxal-dependent enzyme with beta-cystathionase and maltose regulon repressor activities
MRNLNPEYLELTENNSNSMFAWCKIGPKLDAVRAKVNIVDGSSFGKPGYARLNMAVNSDIIKNAVDRLNGNYPKEE